MTKIHNVNDIDIKQKALYNITDYIVAVEIDWYKTNNNTTSSYMAGKRAGRKLTITA